MHHVKVKEEGFDANRLFEKIIYDLRLKTDLQLANLLGIGAPVVSKIRHGHMPIGSSVLIRIHEELGMSIAEQRQIMGDRRKMWRGSIKRVARSKG